MEKIGLVTPTPESHNSSAVVACAKLWPDLIIIVHMQIYELIGDSWLKPK